MLLQSFLQSFLQLPATPQAMRRWSLPQQLTPLVYSLLLLCAGVGSNPSTLRAEDAPAAGTSSEVLFVRRVSVLLREKCVGCHGREPAQLEGALDVRSRESLLAGGESGQPAIVPGQAEHSPLYLAVQRHSEVWSAMPPKDADQLTMKQLQWLAEWIDSGATWPTLERSRALEQVHAKQWSVEDGVTIATSGGLADDWTNRKYDPAGLWAYQPLRQLSKQDEHSQMGAAVIDRFINDRLPLGLEVAQRADRRTLIRRATLDLTGLPATPKEVENFLNDPESEATAFAKVIDRLLASPHYGERMAQHWLDVVRYADSSGFANDFERGSAWRYRDYVIRAFNADKPYDTFVREQLAGDELDPTNPELLIATGFLRMGPWELTGMEVAKVARQRFLDDVTNSVGETFLGHSLQCARCHDHKFDPVPTRDYYAIQSVFATTQLTERAAPFLAVENQTGFEEDVYLEQRRAEYTATLQRLDGVLLENAQAWYRAQGKSPDAWNSAVAQVRQTEGVFEAARAKLRQQGLPEDQYPPKLVGFTPEQFGLERVARKGLQRLSWETDRYQPFALAVYNGHTPNVTGVFAPVRVPANLEQGELEHTCILTGGDPFAAGEPVVPGTLSVLNSQVTVEVPRTLAGRRAAFADWLVDARNPLTARVIVNRLWQWHFGEAIAGNANNFGSTGRRPTHPELLDWLAATLIAEGWSIKSLQRHIMQSDTYCRSTQHPQLDRLRQLDPTSTSYAVFRPRRLSAEEIRDSMLLATGELNPALGGIPCRPTINQEAALQPRQVMGTFAAAWVPNPRPAQRNRRSIYVLKLRGLMDPLLEVFNSPTPDFSCERRETSTVTPQAFTLFNSQQTHDRALALAQRAVRESTGDAVAISHCFQLVLSRAPSAVEQAECLSHWAQVEAALPEHAPDRTSQPLSVRRVAVEENTGEQFTFEEQLHSNHDFVSDLQPADVDRHVRALADVCLVLLNSNEFVYVY